jgi:CPA2 family monovalent cation:H+ antiporter-2
VVEQDRGTVEQLRERGIAAVHGDAAEQALHGRLGLGDARLLVLAISDPLATRRMAEVARAENPSLPIVARTQSEEEWMYLSDGRVDAALLPEHELGRAMVRHALLKLAPEVPAPTDEQQSVGVA